MAAGMLLGSLGHASEPRTSATFDDMYHNSWTVREGVPAGIWHTSQTLDGFLWIASETGLYRFDGIAFTKFSPARGQKLLKDGPVTALTATADGGLWIAYRFGGASAIRHGMITNYPASALLSETIFALVEDHDGVLWGATSIGLLRFDGTRWGLVDKKWGLDISHVDHLSLTAGGDLWVDDGKAYYALLKGERRFRNSGLPGGKLDITGENLGWLAIDNVGLFPATRKSDGSWALGAKLLKQNISSISHTPDGSLWFGAHDGIWRIRKIDTFAQRPLDSASLELLDKTDGLSADFVYALTIDREGSVWAATTSGLDQFRRTRLTSVVLAPEFIHPSAVNEDTSILVGNGFYSKSMLVRVSARNVESIATPAFTFGIHLMYRDPHGDVWINADGKLSRLSGNKIVPVEVPDAISATDLQIRAITMDRKGVIWMSVVSPGSDRIYTFDGRTWNKFHGLDRVPNFVASSMMTDHEGRVWIATGSSSIFVVNRSRVDFLDHGQAINAGGITLLDEEGDHIWVGGTENLDYFSDGRFRTLSFEDGTPIAGVTGVVETQHGDIWFNCAGGIVRVEASALRDALRSERPRLKTTTLNYLDGALETTIVRVQSSTAAQTSDGRLYFLGRQGLSWVVDPDLQTKNSVPPGVFITSAKVDEHSYDDPSNLTFPKGAQNLQINYTATSLLIPQRVTFRYKLQGFDNDWQNVGTRRQAFYTHLPPGSYTFLVMASNNDGIPSKAPARFDFSLPPTFLQSAWFKFLGAAALVALLSALYLLRVRILMDQIRHRLFERLAERERIARDLHDTFFQGIQGLFLRFNTGTSMLSADEPARPIFVEALEQSDRVMAEGRELVLDLRADEGITASLAEDLAQLAPLKTEDPQPAYKVFTVGHVRQIHPICGTELLRIGQEAVHNAFRHANAEAVEVEVLYDKEFLKLRIRDDGEGIDDNVVRQGRSPGRLGLVGMNERAARIGARFSLCSKRGQGTEIEVEVPAMIAYAAKVLPKKSSKSKRGDHRR